MSKRRAQQTEVNRAPENDLRDLAWRVQGMGHLIAHTEVDAIPSKSEAYGIGKILSELGQRIEKIADQEEGIES